MGASPKYRRRFSREENKSCWFEEKTCSGCQSSTFNCTAPATAEDYPP
jgi:Ni,Fe-hydrogenase I small subunit